jgi:hypothetical protein
MKKKYIFLFPDSTLHLSRQVYAIFEYTFAKLKRCIIDADAILIEIMPRARSVSRTRGFNVRSSLGSATERV